MSKVTIQDALEYVPETGQFFWKINRPNRIKRGDLAGWAVRLGNSSPNYIKIKLNKEEYYAHRVAFYLMTGEWPEEDIDHINGNGLDNRWKNLQKASRSKNLKNAKIYSNNTSGVCGVNYDKRDKKWKAETRINGKKHFIGLFDDIREAEKAVVKFRRENGFSETHGLTQEERKARGDSND